MGNTSPIWVDSHCHLTHQVTETESERQWQQARAAGVCQLVLVGIDFRTSGEITQYVRGRPGLFGSVGVHPNETGAALQAERGGLEALLGQPGVVALGETGVDLYRKRSRLDQQEDWLRWHAETALSHDLPLILHVRDAYQETARCLDPFASRGLRAVLHCFSGGPDQLQPFLDWGFLISFSGILTYGSAHPVREAARLVPLDQCLVETDAPWLAPVPHRGGPNEPGFVVHTGEALARAIDQPVASVAEATTANARRFFRLPAPADDPRS